MTLLIIVVELHTGLVYTTIKLVHLGDDDLDNWVQVAPGYTVSLQVRFRANCTEAERTQCTKCSAPSKKNQTVQRLRGEDCTQCTNVLHHSALQCSTAERSALRKTSISVGHHSFSAVQYSHWYTIVCLFTTVGQCNESTMLCW